MHEGRSNGQTGKEYASVQCFFPVVSCVVHIQFFSCLFVILIEAVFKHKTRAIARLNDRRCCFIWFYRKSAIERESEVEKSKNIETHSSSVEQESSVLVVH